MKNITVELVQKPAMDPRKLVGGLATLTQVKKAFAESSEAFGARVIKNIIAMKHGSLLEPIHFSFVISGASRVFLSQITRHRHAMFMSGSQQYQDHSDFPYLTPPEIDSLPQSHDLAQRYHDLMADAAHLYEDLKAFGVAQDQARYVIPGAARNELFVDACARELVEAIFPQRSCRRNTLETRVILGKMLDVLLEAGFGCIFNHVGPACLTAGTCDQDKMCCGKPVTDLADLLADKDATETLCR